MVKNIDRVFRTSTELKPKRCLLGLEVGEGKLGNTQVAVMTCLFQARILIARRWQSVLPPSSEEWKNSMNGIIIKDKAIYIKQGAIWKYDLIWEPWWTAKILTTIKITLQKHRDKL